MMEDMPKTVLTIIVCMLLLAVGIFVILTFVSNVGMESSITQTVSVSDPSVDKTVTLEAKPASTPTVTQFNGMIWQTVSSTYVNWDGQTTLTVAAAGMQG